jgi:nucleotidyltransferase-like protein
MGSYRDKIIAELKLLFNSNHNIYAVWEGGSAATGYLDKYSDLDLGVICSDDVVEDIFTELEEFLISSYGIRHKFRMPEPNWHGHSQCFYILQETIPYFYIDILIEKLSAEMRFTESDRHGNSVTWFDKKNLIDPTSTPEEAILEKGKKMFRIIRGYMPFQVMDVYKQIERGNQIDAWDLYYKLLNRYGVLLNLKYRPHKYDFGLRNSIRDFPEDIVILLRRLMAPGDFLNLKQNTATLEKLILETLADLENKWG